jgi:CheY-like chemotaxis protein
LGIVLGMTEHVLQAQMTQDDMRESLQMVLRNGHQLGKLLDDVLDISKIEAGRMEVEVVRFDLHQLIRDLVGSFEILATQKNVLFYVNIDERVPKIGYSDPTKIQQILNNVVGNAVKFTSTGHIIVDVVIDDLVMRTLKVSVTDSGIGIPSEVNEKIFENFTQAESTTTRRFGGTGLGLNLARKIARLLGGDVKLTRSTLGKGSTFEFSVCYDLRVKSEAASKIVPQDKAKVSEKPDLTGFRILLVEDSPDNQVLIHKILTSAGASVEVRSDGRMGIKAASERDFDLILMDIQMPEMDGYEAARSLRQSGFSRPIVALTAHALSEERERCIEAGFTEHLTKPIKPHLLLSHIFELGSPQYYERSENPTRGKDAHI